MDRYRRVGPAACWRCSLVPTPWATFAAALTLVGGSELQPAIGSTLAVYSAAILLATVAGVASCLALVRFR